MNNKFRNMMNNFVLILPAQHSIHGGKYEVDVNIPDVSLVCA